MYEKTTVVFSNLEQGTTHGYDEYDCLLIYNDEPNIDDSLIFICEVIPDMNYAEERIFILITSTNGTYRNIFYKADNYCWEDFLTSFSDLPSPYHTIFLKEKQYCVKEHYKIY